jgi:N-acetylglucosaminyldiphosphoundecaprenol N-acetyl-beta-D-mannosaminyltransferase
LSKKQHAKSWKLLLISSEHNQRVNILGVSVSAVSYAQAIRQIASWIDERRKTCVVHCNVYNIMLSMERSDYRAIINSADLVAPDGMPLVWLSWLMGHPHTSRVYGPDLMLGLSEHGLRKEYRHYYYGGAPDVPEKLAQRMEAHFPGIKIVGWYSPPFRSLTIEEDAQVIEQINQAKPDIVWVGLGTPKQDEWMAAHRDQIDAPVVIGVGAAFNIHAGLLPQAPRWVRNLGFEWLFRLLTEPRRLWRRYLIYNPLFAYHIFRQALRNVVLRK